MSDFPAAEPEPRPPTRIGLKVHGIVQGVGFRPFVHRLANELAIVGFVRNSPDGAYLEIEGPATILEIFRQRLEAEHPPHSVILHLETLPLSPRGSPSFSIEPSSTDGTPTALVLPDLATCPECTREIFDPANRRYQYPFTNCTHCGPRYSILESLPYDRARTSMRTFALCPDCRREFEDPRDRRFHAQPLACPACGPHVTLVDPRGTVLARFTEALDSAAEALRDGRILALKGLGGYQLLVRADLPTAVARLRQRKHRVAKPFAVMLRDLDATRRYCHVSAAEARLLTSPATPIVLLDRLGPTSPEASHRPNPGPAIAEEVAPGHPSLGVMLPSTPLHHLLLARLDFPIVATSGNRSDEPLCTTEAAALRDLASIADLLLTHDRPIVRPVDDSVARILLGTEQVLRRARGYAPLPLALPPFAARGPDLLGVGAHLKNTVALARGPLAFVSQHIGDLEFASTAEVFLSTALDLPRLLGADRIKTAVDLHPDYFATQKAAELGEVVARVAHHEAHAFACLADHGLEPPALALSWDGTGLGPDSTLWGGEFLELTAGTCRRRASLRPFRLPGGDACARNPRASLQGLWMGLTPEEQARMNAQGPGTGGFPPSPSLPPHAGTRLPNAPWSSSVGRLFDAVACLLGLTDRSRYEGEAATLLEHAALAAHRANLPPRPHVAFDILDRPPILQLDWRPVLEALADPAVAGNPFPAALAFHHALISAALTVALRLGQSRILLTGGCFQNRLLTELLVESFRTHGFSVYWHQRIPPNDGGIALGQVVAARARLASPAPALP